jgi:GNAT superfamily N-acetyltransferase
VTPHPAAARRAPAAAGDSPPPAVASPCPAGDAPPPAIASPRPSDDAPPSAVASPHPAGAGLAPPPLPPDLATRQPTPDDAGALRALVAACDRSYFEWAPAGWTPPEVSTGWVARLREPGRWSLCAFAGDDVVAYASFRPARQEPTPGAATGPPLPGLAHLAALYVHPSRWRQGIGAAMLARAEAAMRSRGYGATRLWTPEGAPAERFYAALGWRRDERSGWDAWLGLQMVGYAKRL